MDPSDVYAVDRDYDPGRRNKRIIKLGANAILAVSIASARAAANARRSRCTVSLAEQTETDFHFL